MSDQNILPNENVNTQNLNNNVQSRKRKRRVRDLSSSTSSSSSSSSCSSSGSPNLKRSRRSRKRKRSHKDRKLEKLFEDVADLKKNFMCRGSEFDRGSYELDRGDCVDDNVSRQLYCDYVSTEEPDNSELGPEISLSIGTKIKDPEILNTPSAYLEVLKNIQRLEDPDWTNVRYSEVQKN